MQLSISLEYKPKLGTKTDYGIGIVGAGSIVEAAHLPAYRKAAFSVVGICDINADKARRLAERFGIPRVYNDLAEMLADPRVEIVDIAVPPWAQPTIANSTLVFSRYESRGTHFASIRKFVTTQAECVFQQAPEKTARHNSGAVATRCQRTG